MVWYTGVDQQRYDAGEKFLPMNRFLLNYTAPNTNVEEEEVTTSYGLPNTNAFTQSSVGGGGGGPFDPYTAKLNQGDFVTNRTNYSNTGYIQGTEPEETYMDKIGALVGKGIGMAIPGANFLMSMAPSREKRLSATDNAFIDMQLANQEQSMHGGNLTNQDRYGYNKTSMFGNYADVITDRVAIANERIEAGKDLRDIDKYYLEKEKEQDEIDNQVTFNDWMNQRVTANNLRDQQKAGIDLYPSGTDIHGGDDITTGQNQTGDGTYGVGSDGQKSHDTGMGFGAHATSGGPVSNKTGRGRQDWADGGRVYLNLGGLARLL